MLTSFHWWIIFYCMTVMQFIYAFSCQLSFGLFPIFCYNKKHCCENSCGLLIHLCKSSHKKYIWKWNCSILGYVHVTCNNAKIFSKRFLPLCIFSSLIPIGIHEIPPYPTIHRTALLLWSYTDLKSSFLKPYLLYTKGIFLIERWDTLFVINSFVFCWRLQNLWAPEKSSPHPWFIWFLRVSYNSLPLSEPCP